MNDTPHPITTPQPEAAPGPDWQVLGPRLAEAARLLLAQYDAVPEFQMGGSLTNEPFLLFREILSDCPA